MSVRLFGARDAHDPSIGRLDAAAARHLRARRVSAGEPIVLVLGAGVEHDATVLRIEADGATCRLGAARPASDADPARPTWLCVGLADLARLDLVVEKATELGASAVAVFRARRSQVAAVPASRVERWRRIARSACEQCGRTVPPSIEVGWSIREVADLVARAAQALVFVAPREGAADAPGTSDAGGAGAACPPSGSPAPVVLVVGPEGGLEPAEVTTLVEAGARATSLGPRVLRFETAAVAALARHAPAAGTGSTGVPATPLE